MALEEAVAHLLCDCVDAADEGDALERAVDRGHHAPAHDVRRHEPDQEDQDHRRDQTQPGDGVAEVVVDARAEKPVQEIEQPGEDPDGHPEGDQHEEAGEEVGPQPEPHRGAASSWGAGVVRVIRTRVIRCPRVFSTRNSIPGSAIVSPGVGTRPNSE